MKDKVEEISRFQMKQALPAGLYHKDKWQKQQHIELQFNPSHCFNDTVCVVSKQTHAPRLGSANFK